jgi:hypothetical protein
MRELRLGITEAPHGNIGGAFSTRSACGAKPSSSCCSIRSAMTRERAYWRWPVLR